MFAEILVALLLGILCGIFTGITPGIHINLVAVFLLSISPLLLQYTSILSLGVFIIAMSITHTFLDFIPSVFLGAPDEKTALAVLPGHRLLLKGMGYEAVRLSTIGCLLCIILTIAIMPLLLYITPSIYEALRPYIGYGLILVSAVMILREKNNSSRFWAFFIFMFTGILGVIVLNIPNFKDPLFPMLSGLFGISTLLNSLNENSVVPKQRITEMIQITNKDLAKTAVIGTASGSLLSIFPGMGPSQAAILGMQFMKKTGEHCFIVLIGGIGTVNMIFSLVTWYAIGKARNGSIIAVQQMIGNLSAETLILFCAVALVAAGIATFLTLKISRIFAALINKVNYKILCISIISFVSLMVLLLTGWFGFLILIISTAMGLIPQLTNVGKNNAMGCLLLPIILYFVL